MRSKSNLEIHYLNIYSIRVQNINFENNKHPKCETNRESKCDFRPEECMANAFSAGSLAFSHGYRVSESKKKIPFDDTKNGLD